MNIMKLNNIIDKMEHPYILRDDVIVTDDIGDRLRMSSDGKVYRERLKRGEEAEWVPLINGPDTKKVDGYTVAVYYVKDGENYVPYRIRQHILVALAYYTDDYLELIINGKKPVVNHINNTPWDNRGENLEWTTQKWNIIHGRVVHSLDFHFPAVYTEYRENAGGHSFLTLKKGISIKKLKEFQDETKIDIETGKNMDGKFYNKMTCNKLINFLGI